MNFFKTCTKNTFDFLLDLVTSPMGVLGRYDGMSRRYYFKILCVLSVLGMGQSILLSSFNINVAVNDFRFLVVFIATVFSLGELLKKVVFSNYLKNSSHILQDYLLELRCSP